MSMSMTVREALAARQKLELDIFKLLQNFRDATGLTPIHIDVGTVAPTEMGVGAVRNALLTGVRVSIEL